MLTLDRFSFGVGDRFSHQAKAHLAAFQMLAKNGIHVAPVWNKSNREHTFIGSEPQSVLDAAQAAVKELGWDQSWHVDADHINLKTVDRFMSCSDFFTIDVADSIGKPAAGTDVQAFMNRHPELVGTLAVPDVSSPITTTRTEVERVVSKYLLAVQDAGKIYRHIVAAKGEDKING
jgi:tagaturonate epimerase